MNKIRPILGSSVNPEELSLTVSSSSQLLIWLVGIYATQKGFDPAVAKTQAQAILDLVMQAIPMGLAIYHAGNTVWGLVRKMFVKPTAPTV